MIRRFLHGVVLGTILGLLALSTYWVIRHAPSMLKGERVGASRLYRLGPDDALAFTLDDGMRRVRVEAHRDHPTAGVSSAPQQAEIALRFTLVGDDGDVLWRRELSLAEDAGSRVATHLDGQPAHLGLMQRLNVHLPVDRPANATLEVSRINASEALQTADGDEGAVVLRVFGGPAQTTSATESDERLLVARGDPGIDYQVQGVRYGDRPAPVQPELRAGRAGFSISEERHAALNLRGPAVLHVQGVGDGGIAVRILNRTLSAESIWLPATPEVSEHWSRVELPPGISTLSFVGEGMAPIQVQVRAPMSAWLHGGGSSAQSEALLTPDWREHGAYFTQAGLAAPGFALADRDAVDARIARIDLRLLLSPLSHGAGSCPLYGVHLRNRHFSHGNALAGV